MKAKKKSVRSGTLLSIDQGTTGSTVSIWSMAGRCLAAQDQDFKQHFPKPGWVEHKPAEILKSVFKSISALERTAPARLKAVEAIGITNQRETVLLWDRKTGKTIGNAIVWQDRRTAQLCAELKAKGLETEIRKRTGLVLDPYFSATKIKWMLDQSPELRARAERGEVLCGTIDTFLIWTLSGGNVHRTDVSNASRTLLMNLKTCDWDPDLLRIFGIPRTMLPEIVDSASKIAVTSQVKGLANGTPITAALGDQQAALFGQMCFEVGEAKCTFGTGSFLLLNTGSSPIVSEAGLLSTVAWRIADSSGQSQTTYALEGGAFVCGAAVQFLRDQLGFIQSAREIEKLASSVKTTEGVEFVPALTGLGAPYWDPEARGLICGLTRGSTRAHIARATLEAMALQNAEILIAMDQDLNRHLGASLKRVKVDGGASANTMLMQLQADYLGVEVLRPKVIESTGFGAAMAAGYGAGLYSSLKEMRSIWSADRVFKPKMTSEARQARLQSWGTAVRRATLKAN